MPRNPIPTANHEGDTMSTVSAQLAPVAVPATRRSVWLRSAGIVLAGSAFVALCANRALPLYFTPVPLTLQPFAVLLLGLLLTPRLAAATLLTYLAEGALGLPVFAPTQQLTFGLAHLFGPTGGYLLAYPIAAPLISSLWRSTRRGFAQAACSAALPPSRTPQSSRYSLSPCSLFCPETPSKLPLPPPSPPATSGCAVLPHNTYGATPNCILS
jgi:hypothetical protein